MNEKLIKKYANLIACRGINVSKNQPVQINIPVYCHEFAKYLVEALYKQGASQVFVDYNDPYVSKYKINYESEEILSTLPEHIILKAKYRYDINTCRISISSPRFNAMEGLNYEKSKLSAIASKPILKYTRDPFMASLRQWCVVAVPNEVWAKQVFPHLSTKKAVDALWKAIFDACYVNANNDPVNEWIKHDKMLQEKSDLLNKHNFKTLKYFSNNGTNLEIGLVDNHIWVGGCDGDGKNVPIFDANMPTEEIFTMPHKDKVNGKVVASKPLLYQGTLIEDFYLIFKDGKVIEAKALKGQEALDSLLNTDEGSSSLGEVALVPYHSPISMSNILFYNTLFDENASCHLALGNGYVTNVKDGTKLSDEELIKLGYNKSMEHVDFMIGTKDLKIIGIKEDNSEVVIFENGDYAI